MIGYVFVLAFLHVLDARDYSNFQRRFREDESRETTTENQHLHQRHAFYDDRFTTTTTYRPKYSNQHTRDTNIQNRPINRQTFNKGNMERDIIYPDSRPVNFLPKRPSKKCVFNNLCEDSDDYPSDYIKTALNNKPELNKFFSSEELKPDFIANRLGGDDERSMCDTINYTSYPKTARNVSNTDKFIVNVEGFKQGLVFETCVEEATCRFSELMPNDYEFGCKQRYVIRRLMALNEEGNPAFDSFEIPSCCVCTYKKKKN